MPFDRVVVGFGASARALAIAEFLALPSEERIKHLLRGDLTFFLGAVEVPRTRAVSWLRTITPMRVIAS